MMPSDGSAGIILGSGSGSSHQHSFPAGLRSDANGPAESCC